MSKYLNIKDNNKRKLNKKKEANYLVRKVYNTICSRVNYSTQSILFNKVILNILLNNKKVFNNKIKLNYKKSLCLPLINLDMNIVCKLRSYILVCLSNLHKLEYQNNILIRYFNINKNLPKNSSFIRIKNRCIISGRSHGIHRLFKLSRIQMRELASNGNLMGIQKSSW